MAFTLRITFSGLCLFVPEPVAGGTGRMHVLMPGMFGHHHGHHGAEDRHVPVLVYDVGYTQPSGALLGIPALARLTGYTLALGQGGTAGLSLCSQIVDLAQITGRPVDPDHLADDTKKKLVSRVTLGAGSITRVGPGVCWEMQPGEFRPIANKVEWEIPNVPGDSINLLAQPLGGGGSPRGLGTLYPRDGVVSVQVLHETPQDLPPEPRTMDQVPMPMPGDPPKHFSAFYSLFGGPVPTVMPKYWGKLADCPPYTNGCPELPPDMGNITINCLVAGATGGGTGGTGGGSGA
jgi:hypothetical protein